jgi:predicted dehydrogenase
MKIIAAVIGTGIGQKHIEAIDGYKNSYVKIIVEINKSKIISLKKKYPDKIITDDENLVYLDREVNLVSIASFDNFHYTQIIKSIKSDKNVIVEKPMCLTLSELNKIKNSLKNKKVKIISNMVLRTNRLFKKFERKIDLKKIYYIEADYLWSRPQKLLGWRSRVKNYSIILGAAVHMIDLIVWFLKSRPISVYCEGSNRFSKDTNFNKENLVVAIYKFPGNILVKISANTMSNYKHFHEIKIFQKNLTMVNTLTGKYIFQNKAIARLKDEYPDKDSRKNLIREFIDNLLKEIKIKDNSFLEQSNLMKICFATQKSLKYNKKINIKY